VTIDEGYIKYQSHWTRGPAPDSDAARLLETWRKPLVESGLIGHYDEAGVGYGNISVRCGDMKQFLISGTQTGHIVTTDERHYSLVTNYDIAANTVSCLGPVQASSEAMTHAAIYELDDGIEAIVHVHDAALWSRYINLLPTTDAGIPYGTPEMAQEFSRLYRDASFAERGIAVMGGHEEGLVSIGRDLQQAATRVLDLLRESASR
jgi:ribulose-5-phosphate 4-epimerase/fuculose-1-phosphate aldolase